MKFKISLALLFLTLVVGAIGYWYWQRNVFATDKVPIEIIAPDEISLGEEITYIVKYKNNSSVRLENVTLLFEYPEGSLLGEGEDDRITQALEDINPGQELSHQFAARIFGKEGETREAQAVLTYTPKNLTTSFRSQTTSLALISSSSLSFEIDLPLKIESSQQLEFDLNYFSNAEYPLSDLRVNIEYPEGFTFLDASPSPIGENEWKINIINKAEGGRIHVEGTIEGGVQEVKLFKATIGRWKDGQFTLLKQVIRGVELTSPDLSISQLINGSAATIASPGDFLHYEIIFRNIGDRSLENLFLLITLDGDGFDLSSVKVSGGTFEKGDNSIVWDSKGNPKLRFLGKGEEGRVEFWIDVLEDLPLVSPQQKDQTLTTRVILSNTKDAFQTKVNSSLKTNQVGYYADEVFGNIGPTPPEVGKRTTYTITWTATNLGNDTDNVKVKAVLPQRVKLTGDIFPEDAPVTFDSQSREIVWDIGEMLSGKGIFSAPPSVSFQVEFIPTSLHRNKTAELVGELMITGDDLFTGQLLQAEDEALDTTLPDDDSVSEQQGIVK